MAVENRNGMRLFDEKRWKKAGQLWTLDVGKGRARPECHRNGG